MPSEGVYTAKGRRVRVHDSLRAYLSIRKLISDERLDAVDRMELLLPLTVVDPAGFVAAFGRGSWDALCELLKDAFGIDLTGADTAQGGKRAFDWDEDRDRIIATVRAAYTLSYDDFLDTRYSEAAVLVAYSPRSTPMGEAIFYRLSDPPKRTKGNSEQVKEFMRLKKAYRLKGNEDANAQAISEYEALERRFSK